MHNWLLPHKKLLLEQINNNTLPHAILVSGVSGAGKAILAKWLVSVLACQSTELNLGDLATACGMCKRCKLLHSKTYPDHLQIDNGGKTIGVDEIRQTNQFLQKTAQIGFRKTLMIADAEKMTISAANALLKTLEEPSDKSVLILLCSDVQLLLPTIISRCRLVELRPLAGSKLLAQMEKLTSVSETDRAYVNLTHLPEIKDDNIAKDFAEFQTALLLYLKEQRGRSVLTKVITDSPYGFRWLEKVIVNLMRNQQESMSNEHITLTNRLEKLNSARLWDIYQLILNSSKQLKTLTQANKQYIVEKLVIDMSRICLLEGE